MAKHELVHRESGKKVDIEKMTGKALASMARPLYSAMQASHAIAEGKNPIKKFKQTYDALSEENLNKFKKERAKG